MDRVRASIELRVSAFDPEFIPERLVVGVSESVASGTVTEFKVKRMP